jgi:ribosomal protein L40E
MSNSYYDLLGVPPNATPEEIKDAYLKARAALLAEVMDAGSEEEDQDSVDVRLSELDRAYTALTQSDHDAGQKDADTMRDPSQAEMKNALVQTERLASLNPHRVCPHCGESNPVQATRCLHCGQQISRPCPQCGFRVTLVDPVCPRCEVIISEYDRQRFSEALMIEEQVQKERSDSQSRVAALEVVHRANARLGVLFWAIVFVVVIGLCVGLVLLYSYWLQNV